VVLKKDSMENLIFRNDTYRIIGISMEVHRLLGFGFSEIVYKDALEIEAEIHKIPYTREKEDTITYKDHLLKHKYFAEFVMFDEIILEIKSCKEGISNQHISQTLELYESIRL
jgi:GxxExxY protein